MTNKSKDGLDLTQRLTFAADSAGLARKISVDKSVKTYLQHPDGGLAYAISYKAQKFIEGFASEHKPQVFLIGHYHMTGQFFIRNVHAYLGGCFQSQTPYLRAKGDSRRAFQEDWKLPLLPELNSG